VKHGDRDHKKFVELRALAFLSLCAGSFAISADFSDASWKVNGVAKVVNLLKDMQSELEKEQEADEDLYDAFTCWCEANDKAKTKAIADAVQRTDDLNSSIEMDTAKGHQLTNDIAELKRQIAENEDGLESSTSLRAKEGEEFHQNDLDAVQAIGNLKAATVAMQKHHGEALTQEAMLQLRQVLNSNRPGLFQKLGLTSPHNKVLASLLQTGTEYVRDSEPASGAIFGILKQMKEEFESNAVKAKTDEETAQETFNEMKTAKTQEIAAGNEQVGNKQTELANANEDNAQSKEDLEDTTEQLSADRTFLADVKSRCETMDKEWSVRTKVRQEEVTAVGEALEILTDDDARDLMSRTNTFLQVSQMSTESAAKDRATSFIKAAAKRLQSPQLSLLAAGMKNEDVFTKVKESIDVMVKQLKKEQKDEVEKKDWCRDELHANDMATTAKYEEKEDLEAKVASLSSAKERLTAEIKASQDEIAETEVEIKRASENRQKANAAFQTTVSDQRATQAILAKAMDKLKGFYSKKASLLQSSAKKNPLVGAPPPETFQPYKKKGGAGGVMGMIENIIAESKQVENDSREGENSEQAAYEQFLADSGNSIKMLQNEIVDKKEQMANADGDLIRAQEDLAASVSDLEGLNTKMKELHADCDYVVENFETRQEARTAEIEALEQAKQIMSGASV